VVEVVILTAVQVTAYSLMALAIPLIWLDPAADLLFTRHSGTLNQVLHHHRKDSTWVLAFVSYVFLISALWLALLWHATIALCLYQVIVRKVRAALPRAWFRAGQGMMQGGWDHGRGAASQDSLGTVLRQEVAGRVQSRLQPALLACLAITAVILVANIISGLYRWGRRLLG
jgi:hypothetical protein